MNDLQFSPLLFSSSAPRDEVPVVEDHAESASLVAGYCFLHRPLRGEVSPVEWMEEQGVWVGDDRCCRSYDVWWWQLHLGW